MRSDGTVMYGSWIGHGLVANYVMKYVRDRVRMRKISGTWFAYGLCCPLSFGSLTMLA